MIRLIGLWLVGCAMCVTPGAADEDLYDGPTAIKPLTVRSRSTPPRPTVSATSSITATRRMVEPRPRLPWLPRPWWSSPSRPVPKSLMNPSSRRGETAWAGPCRPTSSRTTSRPCRWPQGAVRCGWRSKVAGTTPGQNLRPRWRHHRLTADGTSVAAGGPSAAMPTATVRRVVAASDDRKRDAAQLRAAWAAVCSKSRKRRRHEDAATSAWRQAARRTTGGSQLILARVDASDGSDNIGLMDSVERRQSAATGWRGFAPSRRRIGACRAVQT